MVLLYERNDAVEINPPSGVDFHLTEHGSNWLWTAFSIFVVCALFTTFFAYTKARTERLFYHSTSFALIIMCIVYFTMASDLGWTSIQAEFNHITISNQQFFPGTRQIFYTRYIGWFLAFPCYFLNFATFSSLLWSTALFTVACQEVMVISLLIGSLIQSSYKWGYFTFAVVAFLIVSYNLLFPFRRGAFELGSKGGGSIIFGSTILLFMLYLICWALSEGGNVIQPDSEAVFYGILDICFFIGIGATFLYFTRGIDFVERGIGNYESPVFHRSMNHNKPIAAVSATKEANFDRHSGETATDPAHLSPVVPNPNVQPTV